MGEVCNVPSCPLNPFTMRKCEEILSIEMTWFGRSAKLPVVLGVAFNTLVHPQLEYAAPVWNPHTQKNILQIDKIQRRAARWTTSDYDTRSSVTAISIHSFPWP